MSQRISRDQMLIEMALTAAKRSTCRRLRVGAILSREGRPLSTGYNGAPAGMPHCSCEPGSSTGCVSAVHAEANAIAFAAKNGVATDGAELHVTHAPCLACAMLIINAGISRVFYHKPYRDVAGTNLLWLVGIHTAPVDPEKA